MIAEIGHNHQGSLEKCKEMFRVAAGCGVNAVKLQKRDNRSLYTKAMYDQPYENENSFGDTYGAHREALEFGEAEYIELKALAQELEVDMFATAWDIPSADFLEKIGVPAYKMASGDLKSTPLLRHVARFGKPMILSTGGATMDDIRRATDAILPINSKLCILQCTAAYPVEAEEMNLQVITTLRREYPELVIGLSDHQDGIAMAIFAYALGARVFEKHFTLHRSAKGTDHAFSLEPGGMQRLVRDLKRAHVALGDGVKRPLPGEIKPLMKMGKKIVAAKSLASGHRLSERDLAVKSPGDGLPPFELENVIGRVLAKSVEEDEAIHFEFLC